MIFVAQNVRYDLPPALADHLAKNWGEDTPYEPIVRVIHESGLVSILDGSGGWFTGNLPVSAKKPRR